MSYKAWICDRVCVFGLLLLLTHNAYAVRADYMLGVQTEYTDNITLAETNTQDETTLSLLGGFLVDHSAAELDVNARGLLDYRNYLEDTYDDEPLGSLNARAEWRPLPGTLHWVAENYFTQTTINSAAPETPDNRVNANAFSTGPDVIFRLAPATTLETHLRRSEYYFEDSNTADSSRNAITVGWVRAIRPQFSLSANAAYEGAQYSDQSQNDFTKSDYFIRADTQRGRSDLVADVGVSNIDRNVGDDVSGFLGRLSLGRQIRTNARLDLEMSGQYTDSGMDLLTAGAAPFVLDRTGEQISGDIFFDRRIEARYHAGTSESNWDAYLIARDENYELLPQDRKSTGVRLQVHRGISGSLYLNGYGQYRREDYLQLDQLNKDIEFGLGLERRLARRISARLDYIFNTRNSNVAGMDYDENGIVFLIYYGSDPQLFR
ncbi:MAG: outer membrane beta-barrel protein [Gammaproteobacteria bacterium]|nr:outer membrane beta-barrel protein [Gammaproteobacteria bacterium]